MIKKLLGMSAVVLALSGSAMYASGDVAGNPEADIAQLVQEIQQAVNAGVTQDEIVNVVAEVLPASSMSESKKAQLITLIVGVGLGVAGTILVNWWNSNNTPSSPAEAPVPQAGGQEQS